LHRLYDGKREVRVYGYADLNVPTLARMFDRRCRGYEAVGYTIVLPASQPAPFLVGPQTSPCRPIPCGNETIQPACDDSFATASMRCSRTCS
jgi:hypothetical protein